MSHFSGLACMIKHVRCSSKTIFQIEGPIKVCGHTCRLKGLTAEDMLVYQAIQNGKNQGKSFSREDFSVNDACKHLTTYSGLEGHRMTVDSVPEVCKLRRID